MKPIVLSQVGSKWHVFVDVPAARRFHAKGPRIKAFPANAELVPVVRKGKGLDLDVGGEPAKFTKAEAEGLAHQIGNYMLGLGSFVDTYTETRRTPARDPVTLNDAAKRSILWIGSTGGVTGYGTSPHFASSERLVKLGLARHRSGRRDHYQLTEKGVYLYEILRDQRRAQRQKERARQSARRH